MVLTRIAVLLVLALGAALAAVGVSSPTAASPQIAATGDLVFAGCVSDSGLHGCTNGGFSLEGLFDVAASPDGLSVYTAGSAFGSVLTHFARSAGGGIQRVGCWSGIGSLGCTGTTTSTGPSGFAFSPDGTSLYTTSSFTNTVTQWVRSPGGTLTWAGCHAASAISGCTVYGAALEGASEVVVSPDGTDVYVVSTVGDSITHFLRAPSGTLTPGGCVALDASDGCFVAGGPMDFASDLAISPDGEDLYATGGSALGAAGAVAHFVVLPNGGVVFAGCLAKGGAHGCVDVAPLDYPTDIAVSADGKDVYLTAEIGNSVSHLHRGSNGGLVFGSCLAKDAANGCLQAGTWLDGPDALAVSKDGASVYVVSDLSDSVAQLRREANGGVVFAGCLAMDGAHGCSNGGGLLDGAREVDISPDGSSVYVVAVEGRAVSHFARVLPPVPPDTTAPQTTITKAKVKGNKAKLTFTSSEPGSTFKCKLDKKKYKPCTSPKKFKKLSPGKHKIKVVATDAAGNADPTPAKAKVRVKG